jgi:hypothetical protein
MNKRWKGSEENPEKVREYEITTIELRRIKLLSILNCKWDYNHKLELNRHVSGLYHTGVQIGFL